jgi:uncharacterized membrane protein YdjX (TVP38/TMEM64 family)
MLSLSWISDHIIELKHAVNEHYMLSVAVYITAYIAALLCALPGSTVFIIAGGLLFGVIGGIVYAFVGALIGAYLLFLVSRYLIGSYVQEKYATRFASFNAAISRQGFYYLVMVRIAGIIPFSVVNVLSGVTVISSRTFLAATACGMLPALVVYSCIGYQLSLLDTCTDLMNPVIIGSYVLFFIIRIILVPIIARRAGIF